jgi:formylglycine-generating enzyme required for sulfatase activity
MNSPKWLWFLLVANTISMSFLHACAHGQQGTNNDNSIEYKAIREQFIKITPGESGVASEFTFQKNAKSGSKLPERTIKMTSPFEMSKFEVTQSLWTELMGSNPSRWKGKNNSVEMISFQECVKFCQQLTAKMREEKLLSDDQYIRLPTEIEWEYAARSGSTTVYSFGDDISKLGDYAWFHGNAAGNDPPVGAKKANPWGLFDVHGYLWEWCLPAEEFAGDEPPAMDEQRWLELAKAKQQVLRSGSWKDDGEMLTSDYRKLVDATTQDDAIGFRCVIASNNPSTKVEKPSKTSDE